MDTVHSRQGSRLTSKSGLVVKPTSSQWTHLLAPGPNPNPNPSSFKVLHPSVDSLFFLYAIASPSTYPSVIQSVGQWVSDNFRDSYRIYRDCFNCPNCPNGRECWVKMDGKAKWKWTSIKCEWKWPRSLECERGFLISFQIGRVGGISSNCFANMYF